MLSNVRIGPSTSFVTIVPQGEHAEEGRLEDEVRDGRSTWALVREMVEVCPEVSAVLSRLKEHLVSAVPALWEEHGVSRSVISDVAEYLLVFGFVPFRLRKSRDRRTRIELVRASEVSWETLAMQPPDAGGAFPAVEVAAADDGGQCYVYFYRPSASRNSIQSPLMAAVEAYRSVLELRRYNLLTRVRNAARHLIVSRGRHDAPAPADGFLDADKPDLFGESIRSSAQRLAVDSTELVLEKDAKVVQFVRGVVGAQNAPPDGFENVLVLPPNCTSHIYQPAVAELEEGRVLRNFHHALVLALKLPRGFFDGHGETSAGASSRYRAVDTAVPSDRDPWSRVIDVTIIKPDVVECVSMFLGLVQDRAYMAAVARGLGEATRAAHHRRARHTVAFPLQSVRVAPPMHEISNRPQVSFRALLQLYQDGLLTHADFAERFENETGVPLAAPRKRARAAPGAGI